MYSFKPLPFKGLDNTRDLGGFPAAGGKTVRPKKLLRSADLAAATKKDLKVLEKTYHLALVVDFRSSSERRVSPDPEVPGARYAALEVLDDRVVGIITRTDIVRYLYGMI